jgi:hypothetical protein
MDPITNLDQLVARFEHSQLDYKTTYDLADDAVRYEIAKDVAAFANAMGGTIVVGVREQGGRVVRLEGVSDAPRLVRSVADALRHHCVPVPSTPQEHAIAVSPADAPKLLATGSAPPLADVTLLTLNVQADPRGPIGVRPYPTATIADAYRFPVRVSDQTRFMPPTELPMWMNSHERRAAIQLRGVLESGGSAVAMHLDAMGTDPRSHPQRVQVIEIDEEASTVGLRSMGPGNFVATVPLLYVEAVWRDALDNAWRISVRGTLFVGSVSSGISSRFTPRVGG